MNNLISPSNAIETPQMSRISSRDWGGLRIHNLLLPFNSTAPPSPSVHCFPSTNPHHSSSAGLLPWPGLRDRPSHVSVSSPGLSFRVTAGPCLKPSSQSSAYDLTGVTQASLPSKTASHSLLVFSKNVLVNSSLSAGQFPLTARSGTSDFPGSRRQINAS